VRFIATRREQADFVPTLRLCWDGVKAQFSTRHAQAAAAHGQMRKAGEWMQVSVQVATRLGFKETTADSKAGLGRDAGRSGEAANWLQQIRPGAGRSNLSPGAQAMVMTGWCGQV
jgi:hypothetical protein